MFRMTGSVSTAPCSFPSFHRGFARLQEKPTSHRLRNTHYQTDHVFRRLSFSPLVLNVSTLRRLLLSAEFTEEGSTKVQHSSSGRPMQRLREWGF